MRRTLVITSLLLLVVTEITGQEKQKFLSFNGYFSLMQSATFDSLSGSFINETLLHNRLNFKGYVNENITFSAEFRNRLFTGDMVRLVPGYSDLTGSDPGLFDLSWNILDKQSFFLNTTIDRLWADFNYGKLQVRIGRQRINWGQTLVWNPNDVFNAYSFFDFDYIERPGSDAVRLQYYTGASSALELAVKADHNDKVTAAGLFRFNKGGYDIQFLAGYGSSSELFAGAGWSGAFGTISFRGEATWFQPVGNRGDSASTGILTAGLDRTFSNGSMAQVQLMVCNNPVGMASFGDFYSGTLSAKQLAFSEFTAFGSFTWPVTPLFNATLSSMWFPDLKGFFAGPSFEYSVAENVDLALYWQHFRSDAVIASGKINMAFLRFKISF
jgi:hypothetical protein